MGYPIPEYDVRPIDPKTGKWNWSWYQYLCQLEDRFQALQSAEVTIPSNNGAAKADEAASIAIQALTKPRTVVQVNEPAITPRSQRVPIANDFIPLPSRQWSIVRLLQDIQANLGNYPSTAFPESYFLATDTWKLYFSGDGAGWTQFYYPELIILLDATSAHGALKTETDGGGIGVTASRLGTDGGYANHRVLDEPFDDTGWDGNITVPTKNAVRDQFSAFGLAIISDTAYGSGWNGVTHVAPSKNAVYDKVETLLSKNGVNFGPGLPVSVTVVDGQITNIS